MKKTIDVSQAIALNEIGIDPVAYSTVGALLELCATPSEGETTNISANAFDRNWSLRYDNAGDGKFHKSETELIDLLVEFAIWKAQNWPSCLNFKQP